VALSSDIKNLESSPIDELGDMAKVYNEYMAEVKAQSGQKQ
jgi:hypothetical protein